MSRAVLISDLIPAQRCEWEASLGFQMDTKPGVQRTGLHIYKLTVSLLCGSRPKTDEDRAPTSKRAAAPRGGGIAARDWSLLTIEIRVP